MDWSVLLCFDTCEEKADDYKIVASKLKDQAKENCLIHGSDGEYAFEKSL